MAWTLAGCIAASFALFTAGCQAPASSSSGSTTAASTTPAAPAATTPAATAPAATAPATTAGNLAVPVHILAGYDNSITTNGVTWIPAGNFFGTDGQTIARPDITIATSADTGPAVIYQAERYSMTKFTYGPIPNGDYTVKLHFCETYEGITGAGMRVFGYKVLEATPGAKDAEMASLDLFATAGAMKPVVKTVPVTVTDHKIEVDFTTQTENPQINAVEILPGH